MTIERWSVLLFVLLLTIAQYALIAYAARDLVRRPIFQHGNRVSWGLLLVAVPFIGPFIYMVTEAPMLLEPGWVGSIRERFAPLPDDLTEDPIDDWNRD